MTDRQYDCLCEVSLKLPGSLILQAGDACLREAVFGAAVELLDEAPEIKAGRVYVVYMQIQEVSSA